jgi:prophage regulatory protein
MTRGPTDDGIISSPGGNHRTGERTITKSELTGLRPAAIDTLIKAGEFQKRIRLGERAVGWVESELIVWQQSRIAKRDGMGGANG